MGRRVSVGWCLVLWSSVFGAIPEALSGQPVPLDSERWCADATTISFGDCQGTRFSGLRIVFEPQLGTLIQLGNNKFQNTNFKSLEKLAVETNLHKGWVAFQLGFIYPSNITFDDQSTVVTDSLLVNEDGTVDVEYGLTVGLTFIDGIISLGWGNLWFDERDFVDFASLDPDVFSDSFFYVNIQPVSALKSLLKGDGDSQENTPEDGG